MPEMVSRIPMNDRYGAGENVSLMACDQYLRDVSWIRTTEPLEAEEEARLLQRVLRARSEPWNAHLQMVAKHARDRLVEGYQPVVVLCALRARHRFRGMEFLDLVGEANIGVLNAVDRYSTSYPSFEAFVRVCIRHAFWQARYGSDQWLSIPRELKYMLSRMRGFAAQWEQGHNEQPSVSEYALHLGVSEALIQEALCVDTFERIESLQIVVDEMEDHQSFESLFDDTVSAKNEGHRQLQQVFEQALERELTLKQRQVVEFRYGFGESAGPCRIQQHVAELLGIGENAVQNHERAAKQRLSQALVPAKVGSDVVCTFRSGYQDEYYTLDEAAFVLGVSRSRVSQWLAEGLLPVIRRRRGMVRTLIPKQAVHERAARRGDVDQEGAA